MRCYSASSASSVQRARWLADTTAWRDLGRLKSLCTSTSWIYSALRGLTIVGQRCVQLLHDLFARAVVVVAETSEEDERGFGLVDLGERFLKPSDFVLLPQQESVADDFESSVHTKRPVRRN